MAKFLLMAACFLTCSAVSTLAVAVSASSSNNNTETALAYVTQLIGTHYGWWRGGGIPATGVLSCDLVHSLCNLINSALKALLHSSYCVSPSLSLHTLTLRSSRTVSRTLIQWISLAPDVLVWLDPH